MHFFSATFIVRFLLTFRVSVYLSAARHELIVPVYIKTDVPKTNVFAILSKE